MLQYLYNRNINSNFLKIYDTDLKDDIIDFRTKMLLHNKIRGFLPLNITYTNEIPEFSYNITGLSSLDTIYDNRKISYSELCTILQDLNNILNSIDKYMLCEDNIMFTTEKIYADPETLNISLCYCPLYNNNFRDSFNKFLCFILNHIDHDDKNLVLLAYTLQQKSTQEELSIKNIMDSIYSDIFPHNEQAKEPDTIQKPVEPIEPVVHPYIPPPNDIKPCNLNPQLLDAYEKRTYTFVTSAVEFKILCVLTCLFLFLNILQISTSLFPFSIFITLCLLFSCGIFYCLYCIFNKRKKAEVSSIISTVVSNSNKTSGLQDNFYNTTNFPKENISTENSSFGSTVLLCERESANYKLIYSGSDNFKDISITKFPFIIGKLSSNADGIINSPIVSRIHCKLSCKDINNTRNLLIEDMNSTNGTFLNDILLQPNTPVTLCTGDKISIASISYVFSCE